MQVFDDRIEQYLRHRFGLNANLSAIQTYQTRALEGNTEFVSLLNTKGKTSFNCFVGFIDLKGYSMMSTGLSPYEIRNLLQPFLEKVLSKLEGNCLVDKTIGDEVMFVLPDPEETSMVPGQLILGQILGGLKNFAISQPKYNFRVGISHGPVVLSQLVSNSYSEWVVFGECITVAKRLMSLDELANPNPISCAIGIKPEISSRTAEWISQFCVNWKTTKPTRFSLKGVEQIEYVTLLPLQ